MQKVVGTSLLLTQTASKPDHSFTKMQFPPLTNMSENCGIVSGNQHNLFAPLYSSMRQTPAVLRLPFTEVWDVSVVQRNIKEAADLAGHKPHRAQPTASPVATQALFLPIVASWIAIAQRTVLS
jgi:hypothetical protein